MELKAVVVDDNPLDIETLKTLLNEYFPLIRITGEANIIDRGFELIKETSPDVLFLDIKMSRGNGFDLLERFPIRNFEVIFISGYDDFREKAKQYYSFDYLCKPIDVMRFTNIMKKLVDYRRQNPGKVHRLISPINQSPTIP